MAGRTIYLVPTSELQSNEAGLEVMALLEPLLAAHFQLKVKRLPALDRAVAGKSERENDLGPQWLTQDILAALLKLKPDDAAAVMAITTVDLYPDPTWNFVFGEASYDQRVGVIGERQSCRVVQWIATSRVGAMRRLTGPRGRRGPVTSSESDGSIGWGSVGGRARRARHAWRADPSRGRSVAGLG